MRRIDNILYPTDFSSCSEHAITLALKFARAFDAKLHLLHVAEFLIADPREPAVCPELSKLYAELTADTHRQMDRLKDVYRIRDVEIETEQRRGASAGDTILEAIEDKQIDLVVMGTHCRRGVARAFMGSVASKVMQLASCPVLALPEGVFPDGQKPSWPEEDEGKPLGPKRIAVPIDFSGPSENTLDVAVDLAERFGSKLYLLHVIEDFAMPEFYGPHPGYRAELQIQCEVELDRLMEERGDVDYRAYVSEARRASDGIASFVKEHKCDLLVMATAGLRGIPKIFMGSTTLRALTLAHCPVLALRA
jgi:nucleotide-binding universal stress UspA family protein